MDSSQDQAPDLEQLMKLFGRNAEIWWWCYIVIRLLTLVASIFLLLAGETVDDIVLIAVFVATILSSLIHWYSDRWKGMYQQSLARFELWDGLESAPSSIEWSDWLTSLNSKDREAVCKTIRREEPYFASRKGKSTTRLIENLEESTWWTKHLAKYTFIAFGIVILFVLTLSIILFFAVAQSSTQTDTIRNSAKVFVAIVAGVFSVGLFRLTVDYALLWMSCRQFEASASCLLVEGKSPSGEGPSRDKAITLLRNYQAIRIASPPLPTGMWWLARKRLNSVWKLHRIRD